LPTLLGHLPVWQAIAAVAGVMMLYTGIAFFFRPEANTDNMGWVGGGMNDPAQYSDNINRFLWNLHMALGPGRFTAETLLDTCVLLGLAHRDEIIDEAADHVVADHAPGVAPPAVQALSSARFESPPPGPGLQLDSWKYFQQS
jgi:hypothetical protein